ncbi:MAG: rRNA maturation RNase YbeY [Treponema sp.]|jgi:probable rRNA maturation factor|nr:rRNA maturation RNase YbeY [Treponema sp.]
MNRVDFNAEGVSAPTWKKKAGSFVLKALKILGLKNWNLSVLFCNDEFIRSLNKQYRNRDEATDVLSFALGETIDEGSGEERCFPGDIVISLETLRKQAASFGVDEDEELRRLLVHGILHLNGMDHAGNQSGEPMLVLQEKILRELGGENII